MHVQRNPDGSRTLHLSKSEEQAYLHLGVIASLAGHRELMYKIKSGKKTPEGRIFRGMVEWNADTIPEDQLKEMRDFRDALLHGHCIVFEDGSISISDERFKDEDPRSQIELSLVKLSKIKDMWVEWLEPSIVMNRYIDAGNPDPIRWSITVIDSTSEDK